jgi:hypothetical protein
MHCSYRYIRKHIYQIVCLWRPIKSEYTHGSRIFNVSRDVCPPVSYSCINSNTQQVGEQSDCILRGSENKPVFKSIFYTKDSVLDLKWTVYKNNVRSEFIYPEGIVPPLPVPKLITNGRADRTTEDTDCAFTVCVSDGLWRSSWGNTSCME